MKGPENDTTTDSRIGKTMQHCIWASRCLPTGHDTYQDGQVKKTIPL